MTDAAPVTVPPITREELWRKLEAAGPVVVVDALSPISHAHSHAGGKDEWRQHGLPLEPAGEPLAPRSGAAGER